MPKPFEMKLSEQQRQELLWHRDHDRKPYLRERCAALLMIANGESGRNVAQKRLYRRRKTDTIYDWVHRYQADGLAGLRVRIGRGRKPAFSPVYQDSEAAKEALLHVVHRDPQQMGIDRSRWRLQDALEHCPWLHCQTQTGPWQILDRLDIHYKRGRTYVHSPDLADEEKLARIEILKRFVQAHPAEDVLLSQDECSIYRQPSPA